MSDSETDVALNAEADSAIPSEAFAGSGKNRNEVAFARRAAERARRITGAFRDVILVLLGAGLAYGVEQWRDKQIEHRKTVYAIASIRRELVDNQLRVESARANHIIKRDSLMQYVARHALPPERVYFGRIFDPARLSSVAWQTARESGAINDLPYALMLALGPVYHDQEDYESLGNSLSQSVYNDMLRLGVLPVLRDRFANMIPVQGDFAGREKRLEIVYAKAIVVLDSLTANNR